MHKEPSELETGEGFNPDGDGVLPILDGASSLPVQLPPELEAELAIARDRECGLDERLEAFENVFESEVGDTRLARARNIERETGLRQLYLKFDGGNPTGTQKDRIAFAQAMDAMRRGFDTVTAATCGNYGAALALAASFAGLRCEVYVPSGYQVRRAQEIRRYGAEIIVVEGDYEAAVEKSRDARPRRANFTTPTPAAPTHDPASRLWRDRLRDLRRAPRRSGGGRGAGIQRHHPGRGVQGIPEPVSPWEDLAHAADHRRIVLQKEPDRTVLPQRLRVLPGPRSGKDPRDRRQRASDQLAFDRR